LSFAGGSIQKREEPRSEKPAKRSKRERKTKGPRYVMTRRKHNIFPACWRVMEEFMTGWIQEEFRKNCADRRLTPSKTNCRSLLRDKEGLRLGYRLTER